MKSQKAHHGKHHKCRPGVHKAARSPETLRYERELLIPEQPPWMDTATYLGLARLREQLP